MQNRLYGKFLRKAFAVLSPDTHFHALFFLGGGGDVKCLLFNTQSAVNVFFIPCIKCCTCTGKIFVV